MLLCEFFTLFVLVTLKAPPEIKECSSSFYGSVWALIGLEIYLVCRKSLLLFVASKHDPERIAQFSFYCFTFFDTYTFTCLFIWVSLNLSDSDVQECAEEHERFKILWTFVLVLTCLNWIYTLVIDLAWLVMTTLICYVMIADRH